MNFEALTNYLDTLDEKHIPGCDLQIWSEHRPLYTHHAGESHPGVPMTGHETYWLYSTSKVVCMTAVMQLLEKGKLGLDDPVSDYLPAYKNLTVKHGDQVRPAQNVMTVRHLLTMQGGFNYNVNTPLLKELFSRRDNRVTTLQFADVLARQPLDFEPGTHYCYSMCHDVAAAVVEVAAGMRYADYLRKNIFDPLDIHGLCLHPGEDILSRMAARYRWDQDRNLIPQDNARIDWAFSDLFDSGGGGLAGDVDSYIRFADALACDGMGYNGARILTPESIRLMTTPQLTGDSLKDFSTPIRKGYNYGLGVRTRVDCTGSLTPLGEYGWASAAGAWMMVDPHRHMTAFFAMHIMNCTIQATEIHPAIRELIYEGLNA